MHTCKLASVSKLEASGSVKYLHASESAGWLVAQCDMLDVVRWGVPYPLTWKCVREN